MYKSRKQLNCTSCGKTLHGRIDKRFCSDRCKNKHHRDAKKAIKMLTADCPARSRNLLVLLGVFGRNTRKIKVHRDLLFYYGFDITICDRLIRIKHKKVHCFLNFRFHFLSNGLVEIYRLENNLELPDNFYTRWEADFPEYFSYFDDNFKVTRNISFERISFLKKNG